jgi:CheY-like chemotaxis protein
MSKAASGHGAEALQLARAQPPDVAGVDAMMPRMEVFSHRPLVAA